MQKFLSRNIEIRRENTERASIQARTQSQFNSQAAARSCSLPASFVVVLLFPSLSLCSLRVFFYAPPAHNAGYIRLDHED